jgi:UDP-glucuronate 4-epimerase
MKILITGSAGFIGFHLSLKLLEMNYTVVGVDNINKYYSQKLKKNRLNILKKQRNFFFFKKNINISKQLEEVFRKHKFQVIINLAAEVGVRSSLENPKGHIESNIIGFFNILEFSKKYKIKHLIYASSSSVYGANKKIPYSIEDKIDKPVSLYAATKYSNELMAYTYSHLYSLPTTGLRFFTVYGPWGRPDMAVYSFTESILANKKLSVFNKGRNYRDYTYIDDIVDGIVKSIQFLPKKNKKLPFDIFNLGNKKTTSTINLIKTIEKELNKKAKLKLTSAAPGDVVRTLASIKYTTAKIGYKPKINLGEGIERFVEWYKKYNNI